VNVKKKIFSIWSVLLILVVSIAVVVPGCDGGGADTYALTMAPNHADCGTATDLTGASSYAANATVNIKAVADTCCQFVDWTAPAGTFGNATAAETTFTMPAQDVTVTANFEPKPTPLDHFWCYWAEWAGEPPMYEVPVLLEDQFVTINATVLNPWLFANPVEKVHDVLTPILEPNNHLTVYNISYAEEPQIWEVTVLNQFGLEQQLLVGGPVALAVPTQKGVHDDPECLDHFLVYDVLDFLDPYPGEPVLLSDQFFPQEPVEKTVYNPWYFANPVTKTHDGKITWIGDGEHLVFYVMTGGIFSTEELPIDNQFGPQLLDVWESEGDILAVPSVKLGWAPGYPEPD
jgi:hypothetical protein